MRVNEKPDSGSVTGDIELVPVKPLEKNDRTDSLKALFAAHFKQEPEFYVRVPGRYELF